MTSVSHPLIADIAPARSTNRPDAPAREERWDDERFSLPADPRAARERREVPDAPAPPELPVQSRVDRAAGTQNVPAPAESSTSSSIVNEEAIDPARSASTATPPTIAAGRSSGLIASVAGNMAGGNANGQTTSAIATPATPTAAQTTGAGNPGATVSGQSGVTQITAPVSPTQSVTIQDSAQQQPGAATATDQSAKTVHPADPANTAPGTSNAQSTQTTAQIAGITVNAGRTGAGGTTSSGANVSGSASTAGETDVADQQTGQSDPSLNTAKKPANALATDVSTAFSSAGTTAKPAQPQASTQILAQAMANTPAIAAATPDAPPPSLTAPASVTADALGVTQSFNAEMRAAIDAPTQAAAYTARGAVTAPPAAEQIAMQISRAADQNIDRMTVHLKPAELGKVTIDLEVGPDNRLLAVISAERSETLDLLQRDSKSLERALNDAGVKTDSGSLEFNLKGEGGTAENGGDRDGKLHDGAIMLPGDIDPADINSIPTNTPLILPEGRIDIQV